ncbi:type II toxin-antitoxin system RelE/ParE family toxin [Patescibacteria group bacterium]|nr:type II toxin-antitoxin system RelE/ParE family toxin [Patescibacteria group bacterium]
MPANVVILPEDIQKRAQKLPKHIRKRIHHSLLVLQQNPLAGMKLRGDLKDFFKYRLGDYRIIYTFNAKKSTVEIVAIEHRQGVYK